LTATIISADDSVDWGFDDETLDEESSECLYAGIDCKFGRGCIFFLSSRVGYSYYRIAKLDPLELLWIPYGLQLKASDKVIAELTPERLETWYRLTRWRRSPSMMQTWLKPISYASLRDYYGGRTSEVEFHGVELGLKLPRSHNNHITPLDSYQWQLEYKDGFLRRII